MHRHTGWITCVCVCGVHYVCCIHTQTNTHTHTHTVDILAQATVCSMESSTRPKICPLWIQFARGNLCPGKHCQHLHPAKCPECPRDLQSSCPHPRVYKATAGIVAWNELYPEQAFPLHESANQDSHLGYFRLTFELFSHRCMSN